MYVKDKHDEEDFHEVDFLKKHFKLEVPPMLRENERGIQAAKKADIIRKLCPLMPVTRRNFWINLPVNDQVEDDVLNED